MKCVVILNVFARYSQKDVAESLDTGDGRETSQSGLEGTSTSNGKMELPLTVW